MYELKFNNLTFYTYKPTKEEHKYNINQHALAIGKALRELAEKSDSNEDIKTAVLNIIKTLENSVEYGSYTQMYETLSASIEKELFPLTKNSKIAENLHGQFLSYIQNNSSQYIIYDYYHTIHLCDRKLYTIHSRCGLITSNTVDPQFGCYLFQKLNIEEMQNLCNFLPDHLKELDLKKITESFEHTEYFVSLEVAIQIKNILMEISTRNDSNNAQMAKELSEKLTFIYKGTIFKKICDAFQELHKNEINFLFNAPKGIIPEELLKNILNNCNLIHKSINYFYSSDIKLLSIEQILSEKYSFCYIFAEFTVEDIEKLQELVGEDFPDIKKIFPQNDSYKEFICSKKEFYKLKDTLDEISISDSANSDAAEKLNEKLVGNLKQIQSFLLSLHEECNIPNTSILKKYQSVISLYLKDAVEVKLVMIENLLSNEDSYPAFAEFDIEDIKKLQRLIGKDFDCIQAIDTQWYSFRYFELTKEEVLNIKNELDKISKRVGPDSTVAKKLNSLIVSNLEEMHSSLERFNETELPFLQTLCESFEEASSAHDLHYRFLNLLLSYYQKIGDNTGYLDIYKTYFYQTKKDSPVFLASIARMLIGDRWDTLISNSSTKWELITLLLYDKDTDDSKQLLAYAYDALIKNKKEITINTKLTSPTLSQLKTYFGVAENESLEPIKQNLLTEFLDKFVTPVAADVQTKTTTQSAITYGSYWFPPNQNPQQAPISSEFLNLSYFLPHLDPNYYIDHNNLLLLSFRSSEIAAEFCKHCIEFRRFEDTECSVNGTDIKLENLEKINRLMADFPKRITGCEM